ANMAEVIATIAIVSSIASLIDISAKVVSRLHEFGSQTSEIPKSLRSLCVRLPLLSDTLRQIQNRARAGSLSDEVKNALAAVVSNITEQVSTVHEFLPDVLPADGATKRERALRALKSVKKEDKIHKTWERIYENIDVLILFQTTRHSDTTELILAQLSQLTSITESSASWPVPKDESLIVTRTTGRTVTKTLRPSGLQTFAMVPSSNEDVLFRFSQLPVILQKQFVAEQEKQILRFVEQQEAGISKFFTVLEIRLLKVHTREWIFKGKDYEALGQRKINPAWSDDFAGMGNITFAMEALHNGMTDENNLAKSACSWNNPNTKSPTDLLCAIAGQIAQNSPASMEKAERFFGKHVACGQSRPRVLDLQDLIVEMSLSTDVQRIIIVIDGFDEGDWEQPEDIKAVVDIAKCARKVRMFVILREEELINTLQKYTTIQSKTPNALEILYLLEPSKHPGSSSLPVIAENIGLD
ncbi:MAG: hypothetical protein Q9169_008145, partial [Polycauliona sp. 2 TL-2023]